MTTYVLSYADRREPAEARSLPGETPKEFLLRLAAEWERTRAVAARGHRMPGVSPRDQIRAHDAVAKALRPFKSADVADLGRQAAAMGDRAALTPDGMLDLRGIALADADLSGADFSRCDLSGADLRSAALQDTVLEGARLRDARLGGVRAHRANLNGADLRGAVIGPEVPSKGYTNNTADKALHTKNLPVFEGARFAGADLRAADIAQANLRSCNFDRAVMDGASFESNDFTDATFIGARARRAAFLRNQMHTDALHMDTAGSRMLGNSYFANQDMLPLLTGGKAAFRNLAAHLEAKLELFRTGNNEIRRDMRVSALGMLMGMAAVSGGVGLLGGVVPAAVASTFFFAKTSRTVLSQASKFVIGHVGASLDAFEASGGGLGEKLKAGGAAFVAVGRQAKAVADALREHPVAAPVVSCQFRNGVMLIDSKERLEAFLSHVGPGLAVPPEFNGPGGEPVARLAAIVRDVGGHYPAEASPYKVEVGADGTVTAHWRHSDGPGHLSVRYDGDGNPVQYRRNGKRAADPAQLPPAFRERRDPLGEIKAAIAAVVTRADLSTHEAVIGRDGTAMVRCRATGRKGEVTQGADTLAPVGNVAVVDGPRLVDPAPAGVPRR